MSFLATRELFREFKRLYIEQGDTDAFLEKHKDNAELQLTVRCALDFAEAVTKLAKEAHDQRI